MAGENTLLVQDETSHGEEEKYSINFWDVKRRYIIAGGASLAAVLIAVILIAVLVSPRDDGMRDGLFTLPPTPMPPTPAPATPLVSGAWPVFMGNQQRTGVSANRGPRTCQIAWTQPTKKGHTPGALGWNSVLSSDGSTLYTGSPRGFFYAIDVATQKQQWVLKGGNSGLVTLGPDGNVLVFQDTGLVGVSGDTGTVVTTYSQANSTQKINPAAALAIVRIGGESALIVPTDTNALLVALDYATGNIIWTADVKKKPRTITVSPDGETLYVAAYETFVHAYKTADGTLVWSAKFQGEYARSVAVSTTGRVFGALVSGDLFALNAADGTVVWQVKNHCEQPPAPPALSSKTVFYPCRESIVALDYDGKVQWNTTLPGRGTGAAPTVDIDDTIYFGLSNGLVAIDGMNGEQLFYYPSIDSVLQAPTLGSDGTLYLSTYDNKVFAFGRDAGTPCANDTTVGSPSFTFGPTPLVVNVSATV